MQLTALRIHQSTEVDEVPHIWPRVVESCDLARKHEIHEIPFLHFQRNLKFKFRAPNMLHFSIWTSLVRNGRRTETRGTVFTFHQEIIVLSCASFESSFTPFAQRQKFGAK